MSPGNEIERGDPDQHEVQIYSAPQRSLSVTREDGVSTRSTSFRGASKRRKRNLALPGSMQRIAPGMTAGIGVMS
jgi:hypothetical protein